jgi:predicted secreted acid phosphatase
MAHRPWHRPFQFVIVLLAIGTAEHPGVRASAAAQSAAQPAPPRPPNLFDVQRQIGDYIASGRYDADAAAVVADARAWLESRAKAAAKPAIVLDIDETSLSNWPAYRINGWARIVNGPCDLQQGPCGLRAYQALGQSKAIAPTLDLAKRARELGVAVFFITGRPFNLQEATERNLREQGYEWTRVILQAEGSKFASAVDFKVPERRKLTEQGYTIVLSMGDQESDLTGGYAERTFKLPNPVYFIP